MMQAYSKINQQSQVTNILGAENCQIKLGYIEFAMAGSYLTLGIQQLLTRRVSYC